MNGICRQFASYFLAGKPTGSTLPDLETSLDVRVTIKKLKAHRYTVFDLQYVIMGCSFLFGISIIRNPPLVIRLILVVLLLGSVLTPITSQFFWPAMPIFLWLILFYSSQFIPDSWRPNIHVRVLPAIETILYGGNLSNVLASYTCPLLDILAWIPYGLVHFGAPFVLAGVIFLFAPPKSLRAYGFAFGFMNFFGVLMQIFFPAAPPWYKNLHGLAPANYSVPGSPGGLARIDDILGLQMYTKSFNVSPMVFGAFPSLHSGCAVMEALFMSYVFPRSIPYVTCYVLWIWWSTMYLTHHYFIDLIGGAILSFSVFYFTKFTILPKITSNHFSRWSYTSLEYDSLSPSLSYLTKKSGFENSQEFNRDYEFEMLPTLVSPNLTSPQGMNINRHPRSYGSHSASTSVSSSTISSLFDDRSTTRSSSASSVPLSLVETIEGSNAVPSLYPLTPHKEEH